MNPRNSMNMNRYWQKWKFNINPYIILFSFSLTQILSSIEYSKAIELGRKGSTYVFLLRDFEFFCFFSVFRLAMDRSALLNMSKLYERLCERKKFISNEE